jgi:hypothetical protein
MDLLHAYSLLEMTMYTHAALDLSIVLPSPLLLLLLLQQCHVSILVYFGVIEYETTL